MVAERVKSATAMTSPCGQRQWQAEPAEHEQAKGFGGVGGIGAVRNCVVKTRLAYGPLCESRRACGWWQIAADFGPVCRMHGCSCKLLPSSGWRAGAEVLEQWPGRLRIGNVSAHDPQYAGAAVPKQLSSLGLHHSRASGQSQGWEL